MLDPKNVDNKRLIITIPNRDSDEKDVKSLRDGDTQVYIRWRWQAKPKIVTLKVPYENPHQPINFTIWARNGATEGKWGERFIENDPAIEKKCKMSDPGCFSCHGSIGGTQTPIDKKSLLFPYIIGISLVMISIIYVLMYKKRKEKIQVKKN